MIHLPPPLTVSALVLASAQPLAAQFNCHEYWSPAIGDTSIAGTVLDHDSGRPVPGVFISLDGAPLGHTDCNGRFGLPYNIRDGKHEVSTYSAYFKPASIQVTVAGPAITRVTFKLHLRPPAKPPTVDLAGEWALFFFSDSTSPAVPIAEARVAIRPGTRSRLGTNHLATLWLDYRLLGAPQFLFDSFPQFAPGPEGMEDSIPVHAAADSVTIWLTPRMFDAGWSFTGRVRGNTVAGSWCEHDFAHNCTRLGSARMERR